ncbi:hypothetical protein [Novosphingobium meiothermophilum]|uniref:hypothetical protein n=1 Tax=Novosphingobium meiothermophilum TaxID=2202251 RepID=UPI000D6E1C61|nr:hypothetical protein [Novosphingobium meiothermophilum]
MALTPQEQAELDAINAELADIEREKRGKKAVDTFQVSAQRPAPSGKPRPFSIYRAGVGALRDAGQGVLDTIDDLGDWLGEKTNIGVVAFGSRADNGVIGYLPFDEAKRRNMDQLASGTALGTGRLTLPTLEGEENAGTTERVVRGIGSFLVPFTGYLKATTALRAYGALGRVGQGLAAGALADFTQYDPRGGNIATVLKDTFGLDNAALDALASAEDDTELEARFKAAAAGAPVGLLGDAVFATGGRIAKLYREWRGTAEEAKAVVDNFKKGAVKLDETLPPNQNPLTAPAAEAGQQGGARSEFDPQPTRPPTGGPGPAEPRTMDEVLDFLREKAGKIDVNGDTFVRMAEALVKGDPENALMRLGIDPAKLDFSVFEDPEQLARLQNGLLDIYEQIGRGLGRSTERVANAELIRGAEALASDPEVFVKLYGATEGLGEKLMAARLFTGAHAHHMLALAKEAMDEIGTNGAGIKWFEFLKAFHRHAYFLGTLRGAGSEVGRALQSLQALAKVSPSKAGKVIDEALNAEGKAQAAGFSKMSIPEGASSYADLLGTDAEKLLALKRLVDLRGDVAELTRSVREGNGSIWRRVSDATKETMGSLFGVSTALYNLTAGVTFLGLNGLGRLLAVGARGTGRLVGVGSEAEFRRAAAEVWAYGEGVLGGFREAYRNTLAVLEHEAYSELSLNADAMGLTKLARGFARKSIAATGDKSVSFERADVVNNKAFALTASETRRLREMVGQMEGSNFFQAGLRGLVNVLGSSINAAGTLYRAGTTLFINAPDEFVGTLAARAGAYSASVRLAAKEAAELGLEGADLGQFIKARTIQLFGDGPRGAVAGGADQAAQHAIMRAGEVEARGVLFQDDLELGINRVVAQLQARGGGLASIFVPFIKTPLRIIERTAIDFTPLGLFKDRIRSALLEGGAARDEALARMSLGITAVVTAYNLAEDRQIVGYDGGFLSTARDAGRPSYSFKIGDDTYEFSRVDPIGTLLGIGADLRAVADANEDDPAASGTLSEMAEAMIWATAANVLSKSWLQSIRQLTDLAGATSPEDASSRWDNFFRGLATRAIPASGIQRQLVAWGDGQLREAANFSDGLAKASIGADSLPLKRDLVGRPIPQSGLQRLAGIKGDVLPNPEEDPLAAEMESLSMRKPTAGRTQKGVKLTAQQFSRFLEIRGREVRDPSTGKTMEEALNELVRLPEYQALPKAARIREIQNVVDGYTGLAVEAFTDEDKSFALARLRVEVFDVGELQGWDRGTKEATLRAEAQRLGIPVQ